MALQRHAILLDQDHMAPIRRLLDREDHRGMDAARERHIFPRPLLLYGDVTAFPPRFDGGVGGRAGHGQISISRSGSRSEHHTSELPSLMRIWYTAVYLKTKNANKHVHHD